eukprot:CAMPEP_0185589910 /NCGR_PEP_ID=MMETSP0434-20130131/58773_1 /TAXON_ID=626734 ORGANISM="Favella taraikaensis, Strain Fe Narragansett Bay" /NCGR_SAMPLE_ID=MMETSP0434 /ASSEMBLY_ACC=CAM_ASM_000379 /LENGTH=119 /DNA_ID=CAMNT_0028213677 /DNA_START=249 /DNA_END=608 /DNA_ORIENTATION=-
MVLKEQAGFLRSDSSDAHSDRKKVKPVGFKIPKSKFSLVGQRLERLQEIGQAFTKVKPPDEPNISQNQIGVAELSQNAIPLNLTANTTIQVRSTFEEEQKSVHSEVSLSEYRPKLSSKP